jgi:hypothetical protein
MPLVAQQLGYVGGGYLTSEYGELTLIRDHLNQTRSGYPLRITQGVVGIWRISEM